MLIIRRSLPSQLVLLTFACLSVCVSGSPLILARDEPQAEAGPETVVDVVVGTLGDNGPGGGQKHEPHVKIGDERFFFFIAAVVTLVCLGGVFAGLTLGLLSLDTIHLNVLADTGKDDRERKQARTVLRLFEGGGRHTLLVVLLLANTLVNTSLPIFLDTIVGGGILAILASTCLIVIFGEIIPQAICSRWGLPIGAAATPYVRVLMALFYPVAKPISMLLDRTVGHAANSTYSKPQLKRFLSLGVEQEGAQAEVAIIESVLELGEKGVKVIMTPLEDVYTLAADELMDGTLVEEILANGYSRIPIHEPGSPKVFIGLMLVKRLLAYDPDDKRSAGSFVIAPLPECGLSLTCLEALNYFQGGRSHMLLVSREPGVPGKGVGVVTLEDVVEEMIGAEIVDETDLYVDVHSKIKVVRPLSGFSGPVRPLSKVVEGLAKVSMRPASLHNHPNGHPTILVPPAPTIESLASAGLDLDLSSPPLPSSATADPFASPIASPIKARVSGESKRTSFSGGTGRRSLSLGRDSLGRAGVGGAKVGRLVEIGGDSPKQGVEGREWGPTATKTEGDGEEGASEGGR